MAAEELEFDTFPKLLLNHATRRGGHPAIREKTRGIWHTRTWRELADEAAALAAALSARGLQRGAHVAFAGSNRPRLYAAMCAVQGLGAVAVLLHHDATAGEWVHPLHSADVAMVFAEDQEQVDKLLEIMPRCPALRCIVYDKDRGMRHYPQPELVSYAALWAQGRELAASNRDFLQAEAARGTGADVAALFFTAGTTGPPKGVVLTHAALIDRARAAAAMERLNDSDVAMAFLPPAWIGQHLFGYAQPLVVGHCICCPESAETMLADMREMGPTCFLAPPRVLEALLTQLSIRMEAAGGPKLALYRRCMALARRVGAQMLSGEKLTMGDRLAYAAGNLLIYGPLRDVLGMSRIRVAHTAGEAIGPDLLMFFRAIGINLKQVYGSTETGFFVAMQRDGQVKADSVGPPAEGVELGFTPQREILVRSPGLFKAYHRDPQATARAVDAQGWFHTGDAGYLGDDGQLRIIDRISDIGALSDGTPYSPQPLESRVKFSPYVKEAVAFGNGRDEVCMFIDIDIAAVGNWADQHSISFSGHADLASRDEIHGLISQGLAQVNAELAREPALARCQIHRFLILPKELDADDGVLTRMRTVRRDVIAEHYRALVDALYDDGRLAMPQADVKIHDAATFTPSQVKKVA
jgi:long-chain acyl-CoA synthetase